MEQTGVEAAAVGLREAVDRLLELDLGLISGADLAGLFAELEAQRRRLESVDHALLVALGERGLAGDFGRTGVGDLLGELVRLAPGEARVRVRAARDLGPRRDLGGVVLGPVFVRVAAAQRDGTISAAHARVIAECLAAIPASLSVEVAGPAEQFLVEQAQHFDPRQVAVIGRRLLVTLDPDGGEPRDEAQHRARGYGIVQRGSGEWVASGRFSDDTAAVWTAILDAVSAPQPAADGLADQRTPAQRRHDAMLELGLRLLRSGELPDAGGVPTTVLLSLHGEDLADATDLGDVGGGDAMVRIGTGATISRLAALRLAEQCELFTTVFDRAGAVLCAGRTRRLASPVQRRVLAARDGGCCFPGCTRPPSWCQAHHVLAWLAGGATDIDNLVLVCGFHHREFERLGWVVRIHNGVPE
ncbi:MAG TPA: DUF222 domain-containing protein, partial [Jatrophihabitans sp.]